MKTLLALALLLTAAACGGSSAAVDGPVQVAGTDFKFRPSTVAVIGDTEIKFVNAGNVGHEWVILSEPIESEADFTEDLVLFRVAADSGETETAVFDVPPGEYQVICAIEDHFDSGMKGSLTVESAESP